MRKILMMGALMVGAMCMTGNTVKATATVSTTQVVNKQGGYIYKGVWETIYVNSVNDIVTVTLPAPNERITGCAPAFQFSNNGVTMTIRVNVSLLDTSENPCYFEIGGQQDNGDIVVYRINVVIR